MITLRGLVLYNNKKQIITAFFMITLRGLVLYNNKKQIITAFFMITLRGLVFNNNKKQIITVFFMITLRGLVFNNNKKTNNYSVLYANAESVGILRWEGWYFTLRGWYFTAERVDILFTRGIHLYDVIISPRGKVWVHITFYWSACTKPGKWAVMYLCVRGTFYWSACTRSGEWAIMYLCVRGIHFVSFYEFSMGFWKRSVSVVFIYIILYANFFDNSAISLVDVDVVFFSNFS